MKKHFFISQKGEANLFFIHRVFEVIFFFTTVFLFLIYGEKIESDLNLLLRWLPLHLKILTFMSLLFLFYLFYLIYRTFQTLILNQRRKEKEDHFRLESHFERKEKTLKGELLELKEEIKGVQGNLEDTKEELRKYKRDDKEVLDESLEEFLNEY